MLHDLTPRSEDLAVLAVIQDKRKKALRPQPEGRRESDVITRLPPKRSREPLS